MLADTRETIQVIQNYKRKIHVMDRQVRHYLLDRKKYPHPGHEDLVDEIRRYENRVHRNADHNVLFWLDNLMHSLYFYESSWKRAFDLSVTRGPARGSGAQMDAARTRGDMGPRKVDRVARATHNLLFDKVYEAAKEKWRRHGVTDFQSKQEITAKVQNAYTRAQKQLKKGQRISFAYNKQTHEIQVRVKDSQEGRNPPGSR